MSQKNFNKWADRVFYSVVVLGLIYMIAEPIYRNGLPSF